MSDQYPPAPQRSEDQGPPTRPTYGRGPGCVGWGLASVALLFLSVLGLCSGGGFQIGIFLFVLAAIALVIAVIVGLFRLFTGPYD